MTNVKINEFDTLEEALLKLCQNTQDEIPWIVRLLENPQSPVALPGKISLFDHDCLHILLNRGLQASDEAFVIGFTMGNDPQVKAWHLKVFKIFSKYLYPPKYRFIEEDFYAFGLGFNYGKTIKIRFNKIDFARYRDRKIVYLRKISGIKETSLQSMKCLEEEYYKKQAREKFKSSNLLKFASALFCLLGGLFLSSNTANSGYGFIFLALSSGTMLVASIIEWDKIMIFYSLMLFLFVDSRGIYFWLIK